MRTTMHRACSVAQPDAHPIGHGSRDGWDPLRGSGDKQAPEGTGWGVDRGSPVPARNSAPPGKSAPPGNFPPREISPRGPGGPPGGVPGGVQKGGVWGVLRTPSYGPFGEAYPGPIYIRLYCPGGVWGGILGGSGGVFWGGILGGSGGPRILSQKRGGEKNQNSVPTGRIIKYPKKVHTRGVPGGPGGPPRVPPGVHQVKYPPPGYPPIRGVPPSGGSDRGDGPDSNRGGRDRCRQGRVTPIEIRTVPVGSMSIDAMMMIVVGCHDHRR